MNGLTLRQLEFLVAVADEGSVSLAARRCNVSPGGISLALNELESSLGVQLMLRQKSKGTVMTPSGLAVLQQARQLLEDANQIRLSAKVLQGELIGTLRIGCFATLSPWMLPKIIEFFARQHPSVDIEITEGAADELQKQMTEGLLDICLMYSLHVQPDLEAIPVSRVRLWLLLHPEHPLVRKEEVHLRELGDDPAVLLNLRPAQDLVESFLRSGGFEPNIRWRSANSETIRSMVARGVAYSVLMGRPVGDRTYDGLPVAYRRIADQLPANHAVLAFPPGLKPSAKIRALIDFCQAEFGSGGARVQ